MSIYHTPSAQSAEDIVNNFLGNDIDMEEIESLYIDMLHHYLRPTSDWNLGLTNTTDVLDNSYLVMRLLRQLKHYQRQTMHANA
jgi:hypothetical protein